MAEFCPDCLDKINGEKRGAKRYILSRYPQLCEECGEMKRIVIVERIYFYFRILRTIFFPIWVLWNVVYILWRLALLPFHLYKTKRNK